MLQAGAHVNAGVPESPLIAAATAGLTDFIKCLLKAGADANIPDDVTSILPLCLFVFTFVLLGCLSIVLSK